MARMVQCPYATPILIIPAQAKDVFYCVYDDDAYDILLKFNLSRKYEAPQIPLDRFEPLKNILISSTFDIKTVVKTDSVSWQFVSNSILGMSAKEFESNSVVIEYPLFHTNLYSKSETLDALENAGGRGQMNGETIYYKSEPHKPTIARDVP